MLHSKPNPNKRRSRRLRKKLHIAEFQQLSFDYSVAWHQFPTTAQQDSFIDGFLEEVIVARDLCLGGCCTEGAVTGRVQNPTELDREAVRAWLSAWPGIVQVSIGPRVDAWYEN